MRLPVEVERKLGVIKACGLDVSVVFNVDDIAYNVVIGKEIKTFSNDDDFYEYVDKKLKEACKDGKKF